MEDNWEVISKRNRRRSWWRYPSLLCSKPRHVATSRKPAQSASVFAPRSYPRNPAPREERGRPIDIYDNSTFCPITASVSTRVVWAWLRMIRLAKQRRASLPSLHELSPANPMATGIEEFRTSVPRSSPVGKILSLKREVQRLFGGQLFL